MQDFYRRLQKAFGGRLLNLNFAPDFFLALCLSVRIMHLLEAAIWSSLAGLASHPLFNHREPKIIPFVSGLAASAILIFAVVLQSSKGNIWSAATVSTVSVQSFVAGLSLSIIAYRLSPWHPLANYPGPILAKVSKWWMSYWIGKGNRHLVLQELHKTYGPWLRIGPNEISVNIPAAIRPIYGQMFRAPFYQGAPQDADALITTTNREEHAERLIAWNQAFSADSMAAFRPLVQARTSQLVEIYCRATEKGEVVNMSYWIALWAMDVMGDMSFSGGFETMAAGKDTEGWMEVLHMGVLFVGILGQVPWMRDLIALLPQPGPIITFQKFAGRKVLETQQKGLGMKRDILGVIQDEASGGPPLSPAQAAADASFIVLAGSDTISEALTAFFRYIVADEKIQRRLRDELKAAFDGPVEDMDSFTLGKLVYLDACIQETLRIVPPVAAGPPRYSGMENIKVLDRVIPPNTTVACPTYTMHHDPQNFNDPEQFRPERWINREESDQHNLEAFIPFSYGVGVCIGKQVALHNMKFFVASILRTFNLSFPATFDLDKFDASYKEHNLWVHDPLIVQLKKLDI